MRVFVCASLAAAIALLMVVACGGDASDERQTIQPVKRDKAQ
jgi:hypothetical protein